MRQLSIQPVMQGFYGIVPTTLRNHYPQARIVDTGKWQGFQRPDMLVPTDPLFSQMAGIWYEEQRKLFGDALYFGGDPFHEGTARDINLEEAGRAIHTAMQTAQPGAIWVLQAWQSNPRRELLSGTVKENTLILDLFGEDSPAFKDRNGFEGHPWIWCIVNGFGGRVGLYGQWQKVARDPVEARNWGRMCGLGTIMEGTVVDYPSYQLLYDMAWKSGAVDLTRWARAYATERYGSFSAETEAAWILLKDSAYGVSSPDAQGPPESIFCARPSREVTRASTWATIKRQYDPAVLLDAWQLLLKAIDTFGRTQTFQYDVVDVTRQVISNLGLWQYHKMISAVEADDPAAMKHESSLFLEMILDQDLLLATRPEFQLGRWIGEARAFGPTPADKDLLEQNARTLVTVWGPEIPAQSLHDYSNREWSGLLKSFYYERWKLWIDAELMGRNGGAGEPIDWFKWEEAWTRRRDSFPSTPVGDPIVEVKRISEKYNTLLKRSTSSALENA
jgi:alpha-N-acetylglucosaminidase